MSAPTRSRARSSALRPIAHHGHATSDTKSILMELSGKAVLAFSRAEGPGAGPPAERRASERDADRLHLGVHLDADAPVLTPEPRLLEAAERHVRVDRTVAVDPDRSGLDLRHEPVHRGQVVRPDARAQAVRRIVRERRDLVERSEERRVGEEWRARCWADS